MHLYGIVVLDVSCSIAPARKGQALTR